MARWERDIYCAKCRRLIKAGREVNEVDSHLSELIKLHICRKCKLDKNRR